VIDVQALSKARRAQDARRFALCSETTRPPAGGGGGGGGEDEGWAAGSRARGVERRVLADDESVFAVQTTWTNNAAGKFVLVERKKTNEVRQR